MNFSSLPNGGIYNEEPQHQNYLLQEETIQQIGISTNNQFEYVEQAYYQTEYEYQEDLSHYQNWEQNLDTIVTELSPEEIRWFYKCDGDKRWTEFNGYDSFRIEFEYRQYSQEWHTAVYNTENGVENTQQGYNSIAGAGVEGLKLAGVDQQSTSAQQESTVVGEQQQQQNQSPKTNKHLIQVRGGMYEVDLISWKCYSIFWPGEEFQVQRGTWFYDATWQPVEYPHSEHIEHVHLQLFCGHRLADYLQDPASNKTPKEVLHTEQLTEFHVDWHSPTCVYLYSEAAPSKLVRSVTQRLGFQKPTGCRLLRGYKSAASASSDTERPTEITHLVFVIHGIGQKMDTGRIIRNSNSFRDCVTWLQKKYFTKSEHRAEFFPVEWRSCLKLDGDIVQAITPLHLEKLRELLNASAMDIMYYTSPLFGKEIQEGLCNEINRLYSMFTERNPHFESNGGKVSVIAHSLGCVIVYDIVTGWIPGGSNLLDCDSPQSTIESNGTTKRKSGLLFNIENFFCLGSPLSVFLALRHKDPHDPENHPKVLPPYLCTRLYNIFHPTDAVAYRMEPLLVRGYKHIAPLVLHPYSAGGSRAPYELMPLEPLQPEGLPLARMSLTGTEQGVEGKEEEVGVTSPPTPSRDRWSLWSLMRGAGASSSMATMGMGVSSGSVSSGSVNSSTPRKSVPVAETLAQPLVSPQDSTLKGLEHRLDFVLKEKQLTASYLAALTSHTAYWDDYDVAMFVLTRLFPQMQEQQPAAASNEGYEPESPPEFCA